MLARVRDHGWLPAALGAALLMFPAGAGAADTPATPSSLASVFASARAGDRILLASGNYGTFSGGSKPGMVTLTPQAGATAAMSVNFNSSSGIRLDGLTIESLTMIGTTHNVTVANSTFTGMAALRAEQMVNANILFDHNTHAGINVCSTCYEGRLQVAGQGPGPVGVTVQNSTFGPGGNADGIQTGADGLQILNNEFTGLKQISAVHTDALQLYGQSNTVVRGNYFHDFDTAIMAPDGGENEVITDNVFISSSSYRPAIQLGSHQGTLFAHNTVRNLDVFMDAKTGGTPSRNGVVRDNALVNATINTPAAKCSNCAVSYNLFTSGGSSSGSNATIGTPLFAGGANPTSYVGYALSAGSPGKANGSDGADRGIRAGASATPTPTPTSTPSPRPTPVQPLTPRPPLGGLPTSGPGATAPAGPVAAFGFNEADGADAEDSSGNGNGGRIDGAKRTRAGRHGAALAFDGRDDRVAVPHAASLDRASAVTLEAWLKPSSRDRRWRTVLVKSRGRKVAYGLYASDRRKRPAAVAGAARASARNGAVMRPGRWTHLALTYDGGSLRIYVDGRLSARHGGTGALPLGAGPLLIGGDRHRGRSFRGAIDDVRVYGRALRGTDIRSDMSSGV